MDTLQLELAKLRGGANLKKSIEDVDDIIAQLEEAREIIVANPSSAPITLAKLQNPLKNGFDRANDDLNQVHKAYGKYGKALEKNFPAKTLPADLDVLSSHSDLINRAIAMHLIREGRFDVAQTFLAESESTSKALPGEYADSPEVFKAADLQSQFLHMYYILDHLKQRDLKPAIDWARKCSEALEQRGSNLEFELCKLQYLWLVRGPTVNGLPDDDRNGLMGALSYARLNFPRHMSRFRGDVQQLITAMLYMTNIDQSPYRRLLNTESAWDEVCASFTREFCSLLGLSPSSPLYIACTAGAIALPTLLKLASIVKEKRTEWTTQNELPVEIALPRSMIFHAIFVCPVSKEQTTEENPPMMMPCGHVVAKESLTRLSKGARFKCPYCPNESLMRDAKEVVL